jgi:hypothetical protein|tara:strand:+ start:936 stop:1172 length:237 start_codon:yes stop_codon:yes gene_type:complete
MYAISVVLTLMVGEVEKDFQIFNPNMMFSDKNTCEVFVENNKKDLINSLYFALNNSNIEITKITKIECVDPRDKGQSI